MALYEHVFLVRQDASNTQVEALIDQYKAVIDDNGGKVTKAEYWGVKPLAYRIRKNRKAHYALMNIVSPPAAVAEMERQMKINEDVIRFLTLRTQAHEEGPSIMMRSRGGRDRDDRPGRGPRGGGRDRDDRPARHDDEHRRDKEREED